METFFSYIIGIMLIFTAILAAVAAFAHVTENRKLYKYAITKAIIFAIVAIGIFIVSLNFDKKTEELKEAIIKPLKEEPAAKKR